MKSRGIRYVCSECGAVETKWMGRCPGCGAWNSFEQERAEPPSARQVAVVDRSGKPRKLSEVEIPPSFRFQTGIVELDRVLGGGILQGAAILIGGEPGIGKSTLMLQTASVCAQSRSVLYVSGEESPSQVRSRAERLGLDLDKISIFCDPRIEELERVIVACSPSLIVVDSLQTLYSSEIASPAGSVNQMRACATSLVGLCKQREIPLFLIGHITKGGEIAGPKVIEHLVDTVLTFEQSSSGVRIVRALKNRFGSVDEIGLFMMGPKGLEVIEDPSKLFLSGRKDHFCPPGIAYTAVVEGSRTFMVEIQALTVAAKGNYSHVYSNLVDQARVLRVSAILERHCAVSLGQQDIYVNVAGGVRLNEVAIELPLALALWSAQRGIALPNGLVSFGELSLAGEVRPVGFARKRMKSAVEMGFKTLLIPEGTAAPGLSDVVSVASLRDALSLYRS